ncbi:MAG: helix-turn-helix transcriptional regulator [Phaeodactylibacter sp.]|nr:helix-turn-helix transcriptional regulator [Phaeodactylibacter sp.]MCB9286996.1 helix-turn-helix transcriptional regulator [Lewinellaceae bacterium]
MPKDTIENIGKKIRRLRQEKEMTIKELADKAGVTKGFVSRVENVRTIPSLPVLLSLIQALEVDVAEFFSDIEQSNSESIHIRRKEALTPYTREDARGFLYYSIFNEAISGLVIQTSILELEPNSRRAQVTTDGFEYKYILEGVVDYEIGDEVYTLSAGDSLFFDARLPHVPVNRSSEKVRMLVVYFLTADTLKH